jgi:hypothetical protein
MSWKPAWLVHGGWGSNAQRFATEDEALGSARARMMVWTAVSDYRAEQSTDEVNYVRDLKDGRDIHLPTHRMEDPS